LADGEKKQCPICDALIDSRATQCPECQTDLSLFDLGMEGDVDLDEVVADSNKSLDEILAMVTGGESSEEANEILDTIKDIGTNGVPEPKPKPNLPPLIPDDFVEKMKQPAPEPPAPAPPEPEPTAPAPAPGPEPAAKEDEEVLQFECPICDTLVNADATACPNCNAIFVEEGEAGEEAAEGAAGEPEVEEILQFECPICNSMVNADATACPNCNAVFVEEGGETPGEEPAPEPAPAGTKATDVEDQILAEFGAAPAGEPTPEPEPVAEEPPEPAPKPMMRKKLRKKIPKKKKKAPEPAPPAADGEGKELSFVERMRIMREKAGKQPEPAPAPAPEPTVKPGPAKKPVAAPKPKAAPKPAPAPAKKPAAKPKTDLTRLSDSVLYKRLSQLVSETKPLLAEAKSVGVDISGSRSLIGKAIAAGKKKDYMTAVTLVQEAKDQVTVAIAAQVQSMLKAYAKKLDALRKSGMDISAQESALKNIVLAYDSGDHSKAATLMRAQDLPVPTTPKAAPKPATPVPAPAPAPTAPVQVAAAATGNEAQTLAIYQERLGEMKYLGIDVPGFEGLVQQAASALNSGDASGAATALASAKATFDQNGPGLLRHELGKSKPLLLEAKMVGANITKPVSMIKEANIAIKRKDFFSAVRHLKRFREEIDKLRG